MNAVDIFSKLPKEVQDQIIQFEKNLPRGYHESFKAALNSVVESSYWLNRAATDLSWHNPDDLPAANQELQMIMPNGALAHGYHNGEAWCNKSHVIISKPLKYQYVIRPTDIYM